MGVPKHPDQTGPASPPCQPEHPHRHGVRAFVSLGEIVTRSEPMSVRDWAIQMHGPQRYGSDPYIRHLDDVVAVLAEHGLNNERHQIAGWLHDSLEDTQILPQAIEAECGPDILWAVQFCTDEKGHPNRRTRKAATLARCTAQIKQNQIEAMQPASKVTLAVQVKLADRIANLRNCTKTGNVGLLAMYRKEGHAFKDALHVPGMPGVDSLWLEHDRLAGLYDSLD